MDLEWISKYIDRDEFYSFLVGTGVALFYFMLFFTTGSHLGLQPTIESHLLAVFFFILFVLIGTIATYSVNSVSFLLLTLIFKNFDKYPFNDETLKTVHKLIHLPLLVSSGVILLFLKLKKFVERIFPDLSFIWVVILLIFIFICNLTIAISFFYYFNREAKKIHSKL